MLSRVACLCLFLELRGNVARLPDERQAFPHLLSLSLSSVVMKGLLTGLFSCFFEPICVFSKIHPLSSTPATEPNKGMHLCWRVSSQRAPWLPRGYTQGDCSPRLTLKPLFSRCVRHMRFLAAFYCNCGILRCISLFPHRECDQPIDQVGPPGLLSRQRLRPK